MKQPSTTHALLAVVFVVCHACTASDSAPAHEALPASSPSPPTSDPPIPAELPAPPDPAIPAKPPVPIPSPVPGFVLSTVEQTTILPLDGSPPTTAAGLWVQDDRTTPPSITHALLLTRARTDALERAFAAPQPPH